MMGEGRVEDGAGALYPPRKWRGRCRRFIEAKGGEQVAFGGVAGGGDGVVVGQSVPQGMLFKRASLIQYTYVTINSVTNQQIG